MLNQEVQLDGDNKFALAYRDPFAPGTWTGLFHLVHLSSLCCTTIGMSSRPCGYGTSLPGDGAWCRSRGSAYHSHSLLPCEPFAYCNGNDINMNIYRWCSVVHCHKSDYKAPDMLG